MAGSSPSNPVIPADGSQADPWVGRRLGKYLLMQPLGRGGMGAVYEAQDELLGRRVAIKLLADANVGAFEDTATESAGARRLLAEARRAARLNHPNVVTVYEVQPFEGGYFLVMEIIEGCSVQALLSGCGAMDWREATRIAAEACRGLVAAHRAGMVHRDIKPANLLIASDGTTKLADFGVAKGAAAEGIALTATAAGVAVGTPTYMSPEQCRSEEVDDRSDIYSLGATYYAMLVGGPPYIAETAVQVMFAHCGLPVPDPRTTMPSVPPECAGIVQRAMAKSRSDRYASADAMLKDLDALLLRGTAKLDPSMAATIASPAIVGSQLPADASSFATTRPMPSTERPSLARRPMVRASAALLALCAVGGLLLWSPWKKAGEPSTSAATTGSPAGSTPAVAGALPASVTKPSPAQPRPAQSGRLTFRQRLKLAVPSHTQVFCVSFSNDGTRVAVATNDGTIRVFDVATGARIGMFVPHRGIISGVAWSHDDRYLLTVGREDKCARVTDVKTWKYGTATELGSQEGLAAIFSRDGTMVFIGTGGELLAYRFDNGKLAAEPKWAVSGKYMVYAVDLSPDGRHVAFIDRNKSVHVVSVFDKTPVAETTKLAFVPNTLRYAPDGHLLIGTDGGNNPGDRAKVLRWLPTGTDAVPVEIAEHSERVTALAAIGPQTVAFAAGWAMPIHFLDRTGRPGRWEVPSGAQGNVRWIAVTADHHLAATGCDDGTVILWDIVPMTVIGQRPASGPVEPR